MNRQQRRKMEREKDAAAKTISKFSSKEIEIIESITNAKADEKFKDRMAEVEEIMSRCVSAYFIELFPDKSWQDIFNIENGLAKLMVEDTEKWRRLLEGKDGKMGKKVLKELEEKVRNSAKDLIEKDEKQKEAIEILVNLYPMLSRACVTTAYKKVKSELAIDKEVKNSEVEKATEYIFGEDNQQELKEEVQDMKKEEVRVSNLKVVKKVLEVEGEFGTYTVNENGITTGEENFKSVEDLRKYKEKELKLFEMRCNEIEEVFNLD